MSTEEKPSTIYVFSRGTLTCPCGTILFPSQQVASSRGRTHAGQEMPFLTFILREGVSPSLRPGGFSNVIKHSPLRFRLPKHRVRRVKQAVKIPHPWAESRAANYKTRGKKGGIERRSTSQAHAGVGEGGGSINTPHSARIKWNPNCFVHMILTTAPGGQGKDEGERKAGKKREGTGEKFEFCDGRENAWCILGSFSFRVVELS